MVLIERLRRPSAMLAAALMFLASLTPLLVNSQRTNASVALMGAREIQMSSTQGGATSVTYLVTFNLSAGWTGNLGGIVVTFCSTSPIINDVTCTLPPGFVVGTAVANQSTNISTFATTQFEDHDGTGATANNTVTLSNATAITPSAGNTVSFEVTGVTNPTHAANPGTFYARVYTYATEAQAQGYTLANPDVVGTARDAGGVAMSTADQITIQSKVQERLTFCVYTSAVNYSTCTGTTTTNPVILGDGNGVLDPSVDHVSKETKYNITTNASNGATIRAKGATLTSGGFTIDGAGSTPADGTQEASTEGAEQFGFCNYRDTGGGVAGLTPVTPYDHASCGSTTQGANGDGGAQFAFDLTTACNASNATPANPNTLESQALDCRYGDSIATKTAGAFSTGIVAFIGNISNTTEPGIYTTTMTFIATGNY